MAHYLDTSALVKLVVEEAETSGLLKWLSEQPQNPVTCDLARAELLRAVRRAAPDRLVRAREVLDTITLTEVTTPDFSTQASSEHMMQSTSRPRSISAMTSMAW